MQRISLLILIAGLLTTIACDRANRQPTSSLTKVKVGITTSYIGEAATFVAKKQGFFQEAGLKINLKHNQAGRESIKDLLNKEVDIAHVAETPVVHAMINDSYIKGDFPPFQIFADMIYSHNIQKIIARKDHGIQEPQDIIGKKVGVYRGTQLGYYLDSFLLEHGISKKKIDVVDLSPPEQIQAIKQGVIDVAVLWEPYATRLHRSLDDSSITLTTNLTYSTLWLATTLDSYARDHSKILKKYLKALQRAQRYIENYPDTAQVIVARQTDTPHSIVEDLWDEIQFELSLSERMLTLLDEQARWLRRNGIADTARYDFIKLINPKPMQSVYPKGITILQ